eukprot:5840368-Pleurochrysis_carterae.AAC.1
MTRDRHERHTINRDARAGAILSIGDLTWELPSAQSYHVKLLIKIALFGNLVFSTLISLVVSLAVRYATKM